MSELLIIGAGGHGKVVADTALQMSLFESIAFVDSNYPDIKTCLGLPVIGSDRELFTLVKRFSHCIVAIGNNAYRLKLTKQLIAYNIQLATLVHPTAYVATSSVIAEGSVVFANAVVQPECQLGLASIVNTGSTIDHDCVLGNAVHLSPGVHLSGKVSIGERSWLGTGVSVKNAITIGSDVIVGVGAAVVSDLPSAVTCVGVPAVYDA